MIEPRPKAKVLVSDKMAQRIARTIIDTAKEKGTRNALYITSALAAVAELDKLVANHIRIYKAHTKRKFKR